MADRRDTGVSRSRGGLGRGHGGVVDVRGQSGFLADFLLRRTEVLFSRVDAKRLQATEFSRFGAHLYPVHVSRFDPPKYPTLVASSPPWVGVGEGAEAGRVPADISLVCTSWSLAHRTP